MTPRHLRSTRLSWRRAAATSVLAAAAVCLVIPAGAAAIDCGPPLYFPPVANFTWAPAGAQSISFDASSSYEGEKEEIFGAPECLGTKYVQLPINSYEWDFGDGNFGVGVNATHTYAAGGTYSVTLTVKDTAPASFNSGQALQTVTVASVIPPAPAPGSPGPGPAGSKLPETTISLHPKARLKVKKSAKATFRFSSDQPAASFECKLDGASFAGCESPKSYLVKPGRHSFKVRAVGAGGTDVTPAGFAFKVLRKSPPR